MWRVCDHRRHNERDACIVLPMTDTLNRREAAEYLGVHPNTIRNFERRGVLRGTRVDVNGVEQIRFPIVALEALAEERVTSGGIARSDGPERPRGISGNPEALRIWASYQSSLEENRRLVSELAALEARTEELRSVVEDLRGLVREALGVAEHGQGTDDH